MDIGKVVLSSQAAENQLKVGTKALTGKIIALEEETRRAQALFTLFQEKRYVEDIKSGRVSQPPIFYEQWNGTIGKMTQDVKGTDEGALARMFESFDNTLRARSKAHRKELVEALK